METILKILEDEQGRYILVPEEFKGKTIRIIPVSKEEAEKHGIQNP